LENWRRQLCQRTVTKSTSTGSASPNALRLLPVLASTSMYYLLLDSTAATTDQHTNVTIDFVVSDISDNNRRLRDGAKLADVRYCKINRSNRFVKHLLVVFQRNTFMPSNAKPIFILPPNRTDSTSTVGTESYRCNTHTEFIFIKCSLMEEKVNSVTCFILLRQCPTLIH
jgi:hypothetical protein